ncbi:NACHT domain-containing protein [Streptomyces umbrinus]|uniref:NACHT domain-containing protein n=1 Tax=Streptomyces umbrinus TaxID=67370 RepID=UPI0033D7EE7F
MEPRRWAWSAETVAAALVVAVGVTTNQVLNASVWSFPWLGGALALALASRALDTRLERPASSGDPSADEGEVPSELAAAVRRQWRQERAARRLWQPEPLRVRWSSTGRPVGASREVVLGEPGPDWAEAPWEGDVQEIGARFRELPHRQLVVIGEPGSGKSVLAMLLVLDLLESPEDGDPVPVLIPAASWGPEAESVTAFLARRLAEEYSKVLDPSVALGLVERGRVLPILDGLDELPPAQHVRAVRALEEFTAAGAPLVVTCRTREFSQAVSAGGIVLSRAAVFETQAVDIENVIVFLSEPPSARTRWEPVFQHLRAHRDGPLAQVLSSPLMAFLARTAYQVPYTDPRSLTALDDTDAISSLLIDSYIANIHDPAQPPPLGGAVRRHAPDDARRWLSTLALQMDLQGTSEWRWWQLQSAAFTAHPMHYQVAVAVAASTGVSVGLAYATLPFTKNLELVVPLAFRLELVLFAMLLIGVSGVLRPLWPHPYPKYIPKIYRPARERGRRLFLLRAGTGLASGLLSGFLLGELLGGLAAGVASAVVLTALPVGKSALRVRGTSLNTTLRAHQRAVGLAAAQFAVTGAVLFAAAAPLVSEPKPWKAAVAAAVYGGTAAFGSGLWTWVGYRATHLALMRKHRLPVRLSAFLNDEYRLGTLRKSGTALQFRHSVLHHRLAAAGQDDHLRVLSQTGDPGAAAQLDDLRQGLSGAAEAAALERRIGESAAEFSVKENLTHRVALTTLTFITQVEVRAVDDEQMSQPEMLLFARRVLVLNSQLTTARDRAAGGERTPTDIAAAVVGLTGGLAALGLLDDLIEVMRAPAESDDPYAALGLADVLIEHGRAEEAVALLRGRADGGDGFAAVRLADLLEQRDQVEDAVAVLAPFVDARRSYAAMQLADLFARQGRHEESIRLLRRLVASDTPDAARRLIEILRDQDR